MDCPSGIKIEYPKIRSQWLAAEATVKAKGGSFKEAIELLNEAISIDPDGFRYFNNRCWCYLKMKEREKSFTDAETAIRLNPFEWKGFFNRARALVRLKRYAEAGRSFKAAKDLAASPVHNSDEEIRKVRYLVSIRECMDPVKDSEAQQRRGLEQSEKDPFLDRFWSELFKVSKNTQ